jgi:hypothetical protein
MAATVAPMASETTPRGLWLRPAVNARRVASWLLGTTIGAVLACSASPDSGRTLGSDLGTFSVDAARALNDCGPNAVGNPRRFSFDVELARDGAELFWDGNVGTLDTSLAFELTASVRIELRAARGEDGGCNIVREDLIAGELAGDAADEITSLTGEMHFAFSATRESTCTLEEQADADLPRLPCSMSYALSGRRTRAPMP